MMASITVLFHARYWPCGSSYSVYFFRRSLPRCCSAHSPTLRFGHDSTIRFTEGKNERFSSFGYCLGLLSVSLLVAPPFGGALYQCCGQKKCILGILALGVPIAMAYAVCFSLWKPFKEQLQQSRESQTRDVYPFLAFAYGSLL
ncbi:Vesicular acetylcholine transporter [Lucilia cuprina]|nr:Vesicular acetylcholine transporter [Lucilia cuprina]